MFHLTKKMPNDKINSNCNEKYEKKRDITKVYEDNGNLEHQDKKNKDKISKYTDKKPGKGNVNEEYEGHTDEDIDINLGVGENEYVDEENDTDDEENDTDDEENDTDDEENDTDDEENEKNILKNKFERCKRNVNKMDYNPLDTYNLALFYKNGKGVEKDSKEAFKWFLKSAKQGHAKAQCQIGNCYESGDGVSEDMTEAIYWHEIAAEKNIVESQHTLGFYYKNGNGVEKNMEKSSMWYEKAAENGDIEAQNIIAHHFENGIGVEKNIIKAMNWYRESSKQKSRNARKKLNFLCRKEREAHKKVFVPLKK
jgi:hypothetical protein